VREKQVTTNRFKSKVATNFYSEKQNKKLSLHLSQAKVP